MTKEAIKRFVRKNKTKIIVGAITVVSAATLTVIGVKYAKPKLTKFSDSVDPLFVDLLNTVDEASKDCTAYIPVTIGEVAATIDKDGVVKDCLRDPNGNLFEVKKLIAFGNKVEP